MSETYEVPCARCADHPGKLSTGSALLCRVCNGTATQRVSEKIFMERYGAALEPPQPRRHVLVEGYRAPRSLASLPAGLLSQLSPGLLDRVALELAAELQEEELAQRVATDRRAQRLALLHEDLMREEAVRRYRESRIVIAIGDPNDTGPGGSRRAKPVPPRHETRVDPPMYEPPRKMLAEMRETIEEGKRRLDELLDCPEGKKAVQRWHRRTKRKEKSDGE